MRSETGVPSTASVSIRFTGDRFEPGKVTNLIGVEPTLSYHKGEYYAAGKSKTERVGMTNLWMVDVAAVLPGSDINKQIDYCVMCLADYPFSGMPPRPPQKLAAIRDFVKYYDADFLVSVFFFARIDDQTQPDLSRLPAIVEQVGGEFHAEIDRETPEDLEQNRHALA